MRDGLSFYSYLIPFANTGAYPVQSTLEYPTNVHASFLTGVVAAERGPLFPSSVKPRRTKLSTATKSKLRHRPRTVPVTEPLYFVCWARNSFLTPSALSCYYLTISFCVLKPRSNWTSHLVDQQQLTPHRPRSRYISRSSPDRQLGTR